MKFFECNYCKGLREFAGYPCPHCGETECLPIEVEVVPDKKTKK